MSYDTLQCLCKYLATVGALKIVDGDKEKSPHPTAPYDLGVAILDILCHIKTLLKNDGKILLAVSCKKSATLSQMEHHGVYILFVSLCIANLHKVYNYITLETILGILNCFP